MWTLQIEGYFRWNTACDLNTTHAWLDDVILALCVRVQRMSGWLAQFEWLVECMSGSVSEERMKE